MQKEWLIFDFDGTIADTPQVALNIVNDIAPDYGFPEVSRDEYESIKHRSIGELRKELGISFWRVPFIIRKARNRFKFYSHQVPPVEGMPEVLRELKARGFQLGILTSNKKENVEEFMGRHGLLGLFEFVFAPRFLSGKARVLRKIRRRYKLKNEEMVMIGDERRDMVAAKKVGIDGIGVVWGFHKEGDLLLKGATVVYHTPAEFLTELSRLRA